MSDNERRFAENAARLVNFHLLTLMKNFEEGRIPDRELTLSELEGFMGISSEDRERIIHEECDHLLPQEFQAMLRGFFNQGVDYFRNCDLDSLNKMAHLTNCDVCYHCFSTGVVTLKVDEKIQGLSDKTYFEQNVGQRMRDEGF